MSKILLSVVALLLLTASNPINKHTANRYFRAAVAADQKNDFPAAEKNYYRALVNARLGGMNDATKAMLMYNLARMKGRLGKCGEALVLLERSIVLEIRANTGKLGNLSKKYFVLARMYYATQKLRRSETYYNKAINIVEKLDIEKLDPVGYALVLEHYAKVLSNNGKKAKAAQVKRRAAHLKRIHKNRKAHYNPVYFKCRT